jgi:hypothetical protein
VELQRLRRGMPLVAFILLTTVCLLLIGFACACLSDQPAKAVDRATSIGAEMPAIIEVWSPAEMAALLGGLLFVALATAARPYGRASPAELQRFLI